jgi:hypothetical protein
MGRQQCLVAVTKTPGELKVTMSGWLTLRPPTSDVPTEEQLDLWPP